MWEEAGFGGGDARGTGLFSRDREGGRVGGRVCVGRERIRYLGSGVWGGEGRSGWCDGRWWRGGGVCLEGQKARGGRGGMSGGGTCSRGMCGWVDARVGGTGEAESKMVRG